METNVATPGVCVQMYVTCACIEHGKANNDSHVTTAFIPVVHEGQLQYRLLMRLMPVRSSPPPPLTRS